MATIYLVHSIGHSKEGTILLNPVDCAWRNPEPPVKCSYQRFLKLPESKKGCTGNVPPLRTTGIRYDLSPIARIFSPNSPLSAWLPVFIQNQSATNYIVYFDSHGDSLDRPYEPTREIRRTRDKRWRWSWLDRCVDSTDIHEPFTRVSLQMCSVGF
jgi:hypothetical protein